MEHEMVENGNNEKKNLLSESDTDSATPLHHLKEIDSYLLLKRRNFYIHLKEKGCNY